MKKKLAVILIPILLIGLIVGTALTRKSKSEYSDAGVSVSNSGFFFDTVITITLYNETDDTLIDQCFDQCREYESLLSRTSEGSDIWKINHASGKPVEVNQLTADLITEALSYCSMTDGKFDISIAAASSLWDFTDRDGDLPDAAALKESLNHIDYRKIKVSDTVVTLEDPQMMIDLGGIAKGYIADQLKDYLIRKGVERAIINLGGNVLAIGSRPDGTPFKVGIQYPFKTEGEVIAVADLSDSSLVTSGGYERYIEKDGIIYHHILNPKTGYAVDNDLLSVTICCPSSVQADALSTSAFVLGYEEGKTLIENMDGVSALFVTKDLELYQAGEFPLIEAQ